MPVAFPLVLRPVDWALATDATAFFAEDTAPTPQEQPARRISPEARGLIPLYAAVSLQFLGALVFVGQLWSEILGLRSTPIPWIWQEYIELLASIGLVIGVLVSGLFLHRSLRAMRSMRRQIDVASGNFEAHLMTSFKEWSLSPSEQQVAIYAMKGFSNAEVAELRGTTPATVKSQLNAIYRKSGFANRQQLISFLVEELMAGVAVTDGPQSR